MTTRVGAAEATAEELHILGLLHIDQVGTARGGFTHSPTLLIRTR